MTEQNSAGPQADPGARTDPALPVLPEGYAPAAYPAPPAAPAAQAAPAAGNTPQWRGMTRRTVFRAVSAVGVVAVAGVIAVTVAMHPGASASTAGNGNGHGHGVSGPVVAYLRNGSTSEVEILSGTTKVTVRDPALASRLEADASASAKPAAKH